MYQVVISGRYMGNSTLMYGACSVYILAIDLTSDTHWLYRLSVSVKNDLVLVIKLLIMNT